jgi:thioredoxin 1
VSFRKKVQVVYTKTCAYCGPTKAIWHDLQKKHKFDYEEIDAESAEGQKLVQKFSIMAVPTTIVDGKVRFIGLPNRNKAEQSIEE